MGDCHSELKRIEHNLMVLSETVSRLMKVITEHHGVQSVYPVRLQNSRSSLDVNPACICNKAAVDITAKPLPCPVHGEDPICWTIGSS